jgi:anti-sigma28 factor (negative regulator of flagellin synthesis)
MIQHGPTCLDGPVTKDRDWWAASALEGVAVASESSVTNNDIRPELVKRVRAEIAAGTYETDEKLELALGRLLDRLSQD